MGGLARRASFVAKKANEAEPLLILDAGGFAHRGPHADLKTEYLLKAYAKIGYHAVNLAEPDLRLGEQFYEKVSSQLNVPFVTCNLHYPDGKPFPFARKYVIVRPSDSSGQKVGVFGVSLSSPPTFGRQVEKWWAKDDPLESAKRVVDELRKEGCDLIVALVYGADREAEQFGEQVRGVDVVIAGRSTYRLRGPRDVGGTILCVNASQGKYIGEAVLAKESADSKWSIAGGELVPLDKNVGEDEEIRRLVDEYNEALKKAVRLPGASED